MKKLFESNPNTKDSTPPLLVRGTIRSGLKVTMCLYGHIRTRMRGKLGRVPQVRYKKQRDILAPIIAVGITALFIQLDHGLESRR